MVKPAQRHNNISLNDTQNTHLVFLEIVSKKGNALLTMVDLRLETVEVEITIYLRNCTLLLNHGHMI